MRRSDLMKPDLLSEIVLLGSSIAIFVPLLVIFLIAIMGIANQQ